MDLFDVVRMIRRQWIAALIGVAALLLAGVVVTLVVPTNYEATGRAVLLLPPESSGLERLTNPYLNIDANMRLTASLVASDLATDKVRREIADQGFTSAYSLALPPEVGPVLDVQARDTDSDRAVRTRDEVMRRIEATLTTMQRDVGAPKYQFITIRRIATPDSAAAVPGAKLRALAALWALIIIATLVVIALRDRSRRPASLGETDSSTSNDADEPRTSSSGSNDETPSNRSDKDGESSDE